MDDRELTSWKEIAEYLQLSVRTAQAWEKERGLPVRRMPGSRSRVEVRTSELERWKGVTPLEAPMIVSDAKPRPRFPWTHALVLVVGMVLGWAITRLPAGQPAEWRVLNNTLVVTDLFGREVWRRAFDDRLDQDYYETTNSNFTKAILTDLDDDGTVELLFVQRYPSNLARSSALVCFEANGAIRWTFVPGRKIRTGEKDYDALFHIRNVQVARFAKDKPNRIVVAGTHQLHFPAQLSLLSIAGGLEGEYWHAGHIGQPGTLAVVDLDDNGTSELYVGGISNAREQATLVVLDPERISGASQETNPKHQFVSLPAAEEIARVFFQRSSLNRRLERYNIVSQVYVHQDFLTVAVWEAFSQSLYPSILYRIGPDLTLQDLTLSDGFVSYQARLLQERQLEPSALNDHVLLRALDVIRNGRPE